MAAQGEEGEAYKNLPLDNPIEQCDVGVEGFERRYLNHYSSLAI